MTQVNPSIVSDMLRDALTKGQHPRLTVTSNSMAPLFRVGDQVIIEAIPPEQLKTGDIVTIDDQHSLLTHRIWAIHDNIILTRGDHALNFDDRNSPEAILGRVIGRIHKDHTLSFQTGYGQWLDNHLHTLAHREYSWLTGSRVVPVKDIKPVVIDARTKFLHRLFYGWAIFITFAVNLATRIKPGDNKI